MVAATSSTVMRLLPIRQDRSIFRKSSVPRSSEESLIFFSHLGGQFRRWLSAENLFKEKVVC